jgi:hypothetical protein
MFPFHTLVFALWIVAVDPYFVPSDVSQISVTSATVTLLSFRITAQTQCSQWWWAQTAGLVLLHHYTCATIFDPVNLFVQTLLLSSTVPTLCCKSLMDFWPWYIFKPQKSDHCTLMFFGALQQVEWSYWHGYKNITSDHPRSKQQQSWPTVSTQLAALPTKQKCKWNTADTFWLTHILLH